jgi:pimeloyl-ACP methyl ester carboxylesterase
LKVSSVEIAGESMRVVVHEPNGKPTLAGKLNDKGEVRGILTQGPVELTFVMRRGVTARLARQQDPVPPLPYASEEVKVQVKDGVVLAGVLSVPAGEAPADGWPAAVLVSGSGPQDRDGLIMGHRPFLVLADRLTRAGIAVLRYDDRGVGGSTGELATATTLDFADDAEAAARFLRARPGIRKSAVGIIGHSEGGVIGSLIAAREADTAFLVLLASPGVSGREVILAQVEGMLSADGAGATQTKRAVETQAKVLDAIIAGKPEDAEQAVIELSLQMMGFTNAANAPAEAKAQVTAAAKAKVAEVLVPWFKTYISLNPAESLAKVKCPVLALNGTADMQVFAAQNLPEIERVLSESGNSDHSVREVEGVNHLFQPAVTGSPAEYGTIEITMSEEVMKEVAAWINTRFAAKK